MRLRLGDLLIGARLVTVDQVNAALERGNTLGGRLGDNLVAMGAIEREALDAFLHRIPPEPRTVADTGVSETELLTLLLKLIYSGQLETARQFCEAIRLPYSVVEELVQMAVERKMLQTMGLRYSDNPMELRYNLTDGGYRFAQDAMARLSYAGPAPVTLADFCHRVTLQKPTNEIITMERIRQGMAGLVFPESLVEQSGPALNSGRAILLYGAPGNGKTSVARGFASVFQEVIYIPWAVTIDGQIIRVFDPSLHQQVAPVEASTEGSDSFVRVQAQDGRWVPCRRPFVLAGGELTLDMLDLRYDPIGNVYEAPLHMKALGGCLVIDDFGRQLVSPASLLNRWIVPLENRVDYLKLHNGKSFVIPFEELVVFSTNMEPEELMDPAFLRRLPYKLEVGGPTEEHFASILRNECARQGLTATEEILRAVIHRIREEKGMELAGYQPRFIVDQVVATCRFLGQPPHIEPRFLDYAIANLRVRRGASASSPAANLHGD